MKRTTFFFTLLAILFSLSILTGCEQSQPDIWDGAVATAFNAGDGTAEKPYEINSGAELAYLAAQVNAGNEYAETYFILTNDINLNNLKWIPIGNGIFSFGGNFDGRQHSILNLSITDVISFERQVYSTIYSYGIAGLFGLCTDADIANLSISSAAIKIPDIPAIDHLYIGTLAGWMTFSKDCTVANIDITNAVLSFDKQSGANALSSLHAGGIVGDIRIDSGAQCAFQQLRTSVQADCMNSTMNSNNVGGIAGYITNNSMFSCDNFSCDLSILIQSDYYHSYVGAFGALSIASNTDEIIRSYLGNGTSVVMSNFITTDKPDTEYSNFNTNIYAICGYFWYKSEQKSTGDNGYILENLRGCVIPADETSTFSKPMTELYSIPQGVLYTETNCIGSYPIE